MLRTAFRIVSVSEGFQSPIAENEALILCLDGMMILIANITLLALFPSCVLGQSWSFVDEIQKRPRKSRPEPIQLDPGNLPPYERSYYKASIAENRPPRHSPRRAHPSPRQMNLVDHEALW